MSTDDNTCIPRLNQAFWQEHTDQWKRSGLSKIAYSQEHDLKPASFYSWSKKLENLGAASPDIAIVPGTFLPVKIDQGTEKAYTAVQCVCVRLQRSTTEFTLPVDLSAEQIEHWLHAIHTLHA